MIFSRRNVLRRSSYSGTKRLAQAGEICESRSLLSAAGIPVPDMPTEVMGPVAPSNDSGTGALIVEEDQSPGETADTENSLGVELKPQTAGSLETPVSANSLSVWREQIRQQLIQRADEWYGGMFSQTQSRNQYWSSWYGCDLSVYDNVLAIGQPTVLFSNALNAASGAVSRTNVQVDGVDEADIVETDGEYLYLISGNQLSIVRAGGVEGTSLVSQTTIDGRPIAMFLNGNRLTVVTDSQPQFFGRAMLLMDWGMPEYNTDPPSVTATVFDISDRSAPAVVQESLIDGNYIDARQIGDDLIVVVRNDGTSVNMPSLNWTVTETREVSNDWGNIWQEEVIGYESRDEYMARIDALVSGLYPPSVYQQSGTGETLHESMNWLTDDLSMITPNQAMLSVVRINTVGVGSEAPDTISVPTSGWSTTIYVTEDSVYLASSESSAETIVSTWAARMGWPSEISRTVTSIHRIDLTSDDLTLTASGRIDGTIADQHSIDEHNGLLRIAVSQIGEEWVNSTAVYVLQATDGVLWTIGRIEGLAPGEQLYSAKFDGDRAWIVTFRQVDPLFAIDLSDPANPVVTGELKITGYSDYMQSIDENHIVAIGWDADPETGRVTDLQISVFNVSDMSAPQLLHRYSFDVSGYEWSEANSDHHAFHWMSEEGLLAIPLASSSWSVDAEGLYQYENHESLAVLKISIEDGISLKGLVRQEGDVTRSLQVDDFLYSVSDMSVVVISIDDPDEILAEIPLGTGAPGFAGSNGLTKQRDLYRLSNPEDSSDPDREDPNGPDDPSNENSLDPGVPAPETEFKTAEDPGDPGEFEVAALHVNDDGRSIAATDASANRSLAASPPLVSVPVLLSVPSIRSGRPSSLFAADAGDATFAGIQVRKDLELRDPSIAVIDVVSGKPVPFSNHALSDTSDLPQLIPAAADSESLDVLKSALDDESTDSEKDVVGQPETADESAPDAAVPASDEPRASAGNEGAQFGNVAATWQRHEARHRMSQAPTLRTAGWINQSDRLAGASAEIDKVMAELSETGV